MATYLQRVKADYLANAQAQSLPKAQPIQTGANMEQLRQIVGAALAGTPVANIKPSTPVAITPAVDNPSDSGNVQITLNKKFVKIDYIKSGAETKTVQLKTINSFFAMIMNLFAKIFPSCVQGAAKFKIDNETVYVRRSFIQAAFPNGQVPRHAFQTKDTVANRVSLETSARLHFMN